VARRLVPTAPVAARAKPSRVHNAYGGGSPSAGGQAAAAWRPWGSSRRFPAGASSLPRTSRAGPALDTRVVGGAPCPSGVCPGRCLGNSLVQITDHKWVTFLSGYAQPLLVPPDRFHRCCGVIAECGFRIADSLTNPANQHSAIRNPQFRRRPIREMPQRVPLAPVPENKVAHRSQFGTSLRLALSHF
jgi:hypothetical protein